MDYITKSLNDKDRRLLHEECRPGYGAIFIVGMLGLGVVGFLLLLDQELSIAFSVVIILSGFLLGWLVSKFVNASLIVDIKKGVKHGYVKELQLLEPGCSVKDFGKGSIAPSAFLTRSYAAAEYHPYAVMYGSIKQPVTKELYEKLQGHHECVVFYAPKSMTLLGIDTVEDAQAE